jgi:hypothetical protein
MGAKIMLHQEIYRAELSQLAFTEILTENEVTQSFINIILHLTGHLNRY